MGSRNRPRRDLTLRDAENEVLRDGPLGTVAFSGWSSRVHLTGTRTFGGRRRWLHVDEVLFSGTGRDCTLGLVKTRHITVDGGFAAFHLAEVEADEIILRGNVEFELFDSRFSRLDLTALSPSVYWRAVGCVGEVLLPTAEGAVVIDQEPAVMARLLEEIGDRLDGRDRSFVERGIDFAGSAPGIVGGPEEPELAAARDWLDAQPEVRFTGGPRRIALGPPRGAG